MSKIICLIILLSLVFSSFSVKTLAQTGGTSGSYQNFENGSIQSSNKGTFAVIGKLNEIFALKGGTAFYGFPIAEQYFTNNQGWCQQFELAKICERELPRCNNEFTWYNNKCISKKEMQCIQNGLQIYTNPNNPNDITCAKIQPASYINQWLNEQGVVGNPTDGWMHCSAAAAVMALSYFGKIVNQNYNQLKQFVYSDAAFNDAGLKINPNLKSCPHLQGAFSYTAVEQACNQGMWWRIAQFMSIFNISNSGYGVRSIDSSDFLADVKNTIDRNGVSIQGIAKQDIAHIILIKGYTDDNLDGVADRVIVNDSYRDLSKPGYDYNFTGNGAIYGFNNEGMIFASYYNFFI